jgi:GT2 family glycosyltransferase/glycosyltransferase involved in cell wall biosynthesis
VADANAAGAAWARSDAASNPFFDEDFFLRHEPAAAAAVRSGRATSGFAVYLAEAARYRRPHWLFDEGEYRRRHPDLTDATLADNGLVNGYDHYLRHGAREGRIGSLFFDPAIYRAGLTEPEAAHARAQGWFIAHIEGLHAGQGQDSPTCVYFDPAWYLRRYDAVAPLLARRVYLSALHHYLANDTPTAFDPLPEFSEEFYLKRNPDVAAAVAEGRLRNGYEHFLSDGVFELRAPCAAIDLKYYVEEHRAVRDDLRGYAARDAFAHYLSIGRAQQLNPAPPPAEAVTEAQARSLARSRAQALVPLFARRPLDFAHDGPPALSVVMVLHDGFALTLRTLASLRGSFAGPIELILVDSASRDETVHIERCVRGATLLRFDVDIGRMRGSNAGMQAVSADIVLLLHSDVELAQGAIAAALDRLACDPAIGAVGGKVVRAHGRLQEAGGIVWRDGAALPYLRDAAADAPEANFVRDVDWCSSAFLMARAALLDRLQGFSIDFPPGSLEDADLCLRIADAGFRVVYDPSVVVHRLQEGAAPGARLPVAEIAEARRLFVERHAAALRGRRLIGPTSAVFARSAGAGGRRVLFVAETVPLRMQGGDGPRGNDLIAAMAAMGCQVTVFPTLPRDTDLAAIHADMPDTVEVMHDAARDDLGPFLADRAGYYDVAWIAGAPTLDRVRGILAGANRPPLVILDIPALGADPLDAAPCDHLVAVTEPEAARLRALGSAKVSVLGPIATPAPTPRRFEARAGMLFVGALAGAAAPNYDGLCWFVDAVLPLVQQALGWETRLTIAGPVADSTLLDRFRGHPRITLRGTLVDLAPLYDAHRLFVAPARTGAGVPYKLFEAAAFGLPVVATDPPATQTGWEDGQELLSAPATEPERFAAHIVALYRDPALWQRLRDTALARVAADCSPQRAAAALRGVMDGSSRP